LVRRVVYNTVLLSVLDLLQNIIISDTITIIDVRTHLNNNFEYIFKIYNFFWGRKDTPQYPLVMPMPGALFRTCGNTVRMVVEKKN
jgi:hypothetical protein